jgi:DNA-binding FrmR family transcriptional regulator
MSNHRRNEVAKRMARIHGHVYGIIHMIDEGRPYPEIVQQISAVKSALDGAIQVIVDDLVEDCVANVSSRKGVSESILELKQVVARSR